MYVDRNGNGDLTEPGEKVTADKGDGIDEGEHTFKLGDFPDGTRLHRALSVGVSKFDVFLAKQFGFAKVLPAMESKARAYCVSIGMEMPGWMGAGVGWRVGQHTFSGMSKAFCSLPTGPRTRRSSTSAARCRLRSSARRG